MKPEVRALEGRDHEAVVALSLRASAPVFESLQRVLGESGVYAHLHPDWRLNQRRAVEAVCSGEGFHVWVADAQRGVCGFVAVRLDHDESIGEIYMLAVDPVDQRKDVGATLTSFALHWIKDNGMALAMAETGATQGTLRRDVSTSGPASPNCRSPGTSRSSRPSRPLDPSNEADTRHDGRTSRVSPAPARRFRLRDGQRGAPTDECPGRALSSGRDRAALALAHRSRDARPLSLPAGRFAYQVPPDAGGTLIGAVA